MWNDFLNGSKIIILSFTKHEKWKRGKIGVMEVSWETTAII